jgi:hypothetical protein
VSELEKTQGGQLGKLSFASMLSNVDAVVSTGVLEQDKARLIGVPHMITRLTFRPPTPSPTVDDPNAMTDYVSIECVVADMPRIMQAIERRWIPGVTDLSGFAFSPEESLVYNDGSTGIRRQLVKFLAQAERITLPPRPSNVGDEFFDMPWTEWEAFDNYTFQNVEGSDTKIEVPDFDFRVFAEHGLRVSEYTFEGRAATTFYLS